MKRCRTRLLKEKALYKKVTGGKEVVQKGYWKKKRCTKRSLEEKTLSKKVSGR